MARGFSLVEWFLKLAGNGTDAAAKGACSLAILVVWTVWCERNARIFNDEERTTDSLAQDIKDTTRLWCATDARHLAALVATQISE